MDLDNLTQLAGPRWITIEAEAFEHNFKAIKNLLKPTTRLLAVVKADAYGAGAVAVAVFTRRMADPGGTAIELSRGSSRSSCMRSNAARDEPSFGQNAKASPQDLAPTRHAGLGRWLPRLQRACPSAGLDGGARLPASGGDVNRSIKMERWLLQKPLSGPCQVHLAVTWHAHNRVP